MNEPVPWKIIIAALIVLAITLVIGAIDVYGQVGEYGRTPTPTGDWREGYFNKEGTRCCNAYDCGRIEVETAWQAVVGSVVRVQSQRYGTFRDVKVTTIYPSEDGVAWACFTGCLFRPVGG